MLPSNLLVFADVAAQIRTDVSKRTRRSCHEDEQAEEQIAFALKQAELGTQVEEICRKLGISEATFYWKKKFGGLVPSGVAPLAPARRGKCKVEAARDRPEPGQGHAKGRTRKNML